MDPDMHRTMTHESVRRGKFLASLCAACPFTYYFKLIFKTPLKGIILIFMLY